jgi:hypothetical protein
MKPDRECEYIDTELHEAEIRGLGNPRLRLKDGRIVDGSFVVVDENESGKAIVIRYLIPGEPGQFKFVSAKAPPTSQLAVKRAEYEAWVKNHQRPVEKAEFKAWLKDHAFIFP